MRDADGTGSADPEGAEPIDLLFLGSETTAQQLSDAAERWHLPVTVRSLPPEVDFEADSQLAGDCLVVSDVADVDWQRVGALDLPVVRYGSVDELAADPVIPRVADAVLEKRSPPDSDLLLEKVSALTGRPTPHTTLSDAVDAVSAGGKRAAAFLVDASGRVRWSSGDLASVLPPGVAEQIPEDEPTLYHRLATVLDPVEDESFGELPGSEQATEGQLLTLLSGEHSGYYRHYSYPVGVEGVERIELLQDVTTTVGDYDRLALFEDLVENAEDGLFVLNPDWQVEYLNRSYAAMLGYDREQLLATHTAEQLSASEMQRAQEATERLIHGDAESSVMDLTLERGDGTEIEVSVHFWPRYTDDGRYAGIMGAVRDITERKQRKRELERYETIIQAVGDPVCTFDAEGRFVYVNDAFEDVTGYDGESLRGRPAAYVIDQDAIDTSMQLIEELRADPARTTATFEMDLPVAGSDDVIPTECQVALLSDENGQFQGSVAVLRDISRLKRREQRLSKFAKVVSHDLRNPLDVALGRAEVLPEIADLDPETESHLAEIESSLKRMEQLIQDVLALTRQRDGEVHLSAVPLSSAAEEAWSNVETEKATLTVASSAEISAHRSRLLRLLENLFRNAIEHGPTGSQVDGEGGSRTVTVAVGTVAGDHEHGETGFYVADDGEGIPPQRRDLIFDDGYTTTADGTGLGLTIVQEISRTHGWEIQLETGEQGGARFEFTGVSLAEE